MTANGILAAVNDIYAYLNALNGASVNHGYERLEEIMLRASYSGLLSELFVRSVARELGTVVPGLARNLRPGGRPDLVPRAMYDGDSVHHGAEGVEVKVSGNATSWQGHNPETGWLMVIQIAVDRETQPVYDREPTMVERVMVALLGESDWTFSGRTGTSRRTPTASINLHGREKLLAGTIYQRVGPAVAAP
jgi:hypothetical protein